jgi:hypothetical protein
MGLVLTKLVKIVLRSFLGHRDIQRIDIQHNDTQLKGLSATFRAKCYKTFYVRNLRMFVLARLFVPGSTFQPSLIFVHKARSLP